MKSFETKIIHGVMGLIEKELNKYGPDGWEVKGITAGALNVMTVVLQREKA